MKLQKIKDFLNSKYYEPTALLDGYMNKEYPDKLEIKNSIGWNLALLIGMVILSIFLLTNPADTGNKIPTIIFCLVITILPVYYLLDRRPVMTISSKGILFKSGLFKAWADIKDTFIENDDSYNLVILFTDSRRKVISLRDRTYLADEISHIIEYFKAKKNDHTLVKPSL